MPVAPATRRYLTAAVALLAPACTDSTTIPQPVALDAAAFEAAIDALDDVLATEPWVSFGQLGPGFVLPTASPAPAPPARVPVVPGQFLGSTFVHDGSGYVADPSRTDAPPDGVRFLLYALQPTTRAPILDAEIATADVRDVGADLTTGFALDIAVVSPGGDVARYAASFEPGGAPPATTPVRDHDGVVLDGAIQGDNDGLTFGMVSGSVNGVTITDVDLSLDDGDLSIVGVLGEEATVLTFNFSMTTGAATLRLTGTRTDGVFQATISWEGTAVATVTGTASPAVTALSEHDLSRAQLSVLRRAAETVDTLCELVRHVVEPVELQ